MGYLRTRKLGKAYRRYPQRWGRAAEWLGLGVHHELAWVLRDVDLDIAAGEAVGIVGANGAGKSTLLKLLTGTVRPTTGAYEVGGRIAALLELGLGFHSEFTGRQNVYMAGHILGMPGERIAALMNAIVEFAEIGDYIDEPVRTYSSGMQVRLAFSVATAVRPDILIVDEALSVGDAYFQHKSFDRIRRFRDEGTTLLFVSHSPGAIKTLCNRALLLDHGVPLRDGPPDAVLDYYNAMNAARQANYDIRQSTADRGPTITRSGTAEVTIDEIELVARGRPVRALRSGEPAQIRVRARARSPVRELTVGVLIRDRFSNDVFGTNTFHLGITRQDIAAGDAFRVIFDFPRVDLGPGSYSVTAALHEGPEHTQANFDWWDRALVFEVVPGARPVSIGVCALEVSASWQMPVQDEGRREMLES
jgi:homopolymeric O-antigen transport system ATP-binding protein